MMKKRMKIVTVIRAGIDGYYVGTMSNVWVYVLKRVHGIKLQVLK
jgi:hypothetical protein